jgi:hypothetical protein
MEVKEQLQRLSPTEREEVALFLRALRLSESSEYRERVMRAERDIDAGRFVTLAQLRELIEKNQAAHGAQ